MLIKPTVQQATQIILGTITREQRMETLLRWRNEIGKGFAEAVETHVRLELDKAERKRK